MKKTLLLLCLLVAMPACKREDSQAAAAAQAAAREQAAEVAARQFEDAYAQQNWQLARGYGDMLLMEHPESAAAGRIKERLDDARAKVEAAAEQRRLAALWAYASEPVKKGMQLSASIFSQQPVDADGGGAKPVQLVFRNHPDWGRSSYLVLESGDFDCYGGCRVQVKVDDAAAKPMAASRPDTDEAIAMFIEDEKALWRLVKGAKRVAIEFPVKAGGKRTAVFEVGGLDPAKLPGWN
ncbi:hypothetical protein [Lysobacter sp. CFH 32150]|uniref:hypothetical protein n=1 Tax=Lysobacter sp. CFH 32150 TaxID=2927128 RepID=UPI001FA7A6A3|nr:hypothetical protein [Lysobacter sp. CFH 32150]MCI4568189.1 hypothetical protein [Lysobacter sp. CFH 32150]